MIGWHHRLSAHEFKQILGDSEGQGSLVCYSPWGLKELDTTEQLNNKKATILAGIIPRTEEPGGLQSTGSQKSWASQQLNISNNFPSTKFLSS